MVEAAGVEPASENVQQASATCLVSARVSPLEVRRQPVNGQPSKSFTVGSKANRSAISSFMTPIIQPKERNRMERSPRFTQREVVLDLQLLLVRLFNEADGTSACSYPQKPSPSKPERPHFVIRIIYFNNQSKKNNPKFLSRVHVDIRPRSSDSNFFTLKTIDAHTIRIRIPDKSNDKGERQCPSKRPG